MKRLALAAVLGGFGLGCGIILADIAQRDLVLEPYTRLSVSSDQGSVEVFAFGRNGFNLYHYMFGSLRDIGDVGHEPDGDTLEVFSVCDRPDFCTVDWSIEIPLGVAVDVRSGIGDVRLIDLDAPTTVEIDEGSFEGNGLATPTFELTAGSADVTAEFVAAPQSVEIRVTEGAVALTVPPGSYRCALEVGEGDADPGDVTCDPDATASLVVAVEVGSIVLQQGEQP